MSEEKPSDVKYYQGNPYLPILFENDEILVYTNSSNEISVVDVKSGITIRVSAYHREGNGLQIATTGLVEPILVNGMIRWRVRSRH